MKKIIIFLMMFVFAFSTNFVYVFADDNDIPPIEVPEQKPTLPQIPDLVVSSPASTMSLKAGQSLTTNLVLKNLGFGAAQSLYIMPSSTADINVRFADTTGIGSIMGAATQNISMTITAPSTLKTGTYTVTVNYKYLDVERKSYSGSGSFIIQVTNTKEDESLSMVLKNFETSAQTIYPGDEFTLSATLENTSTLLAKNVQVVVGGLSVDAINLRSNTNKNSFETFNGKASEPISYNLIASKKLKAGSYPVTIDLKYKDKDGKDYTENYSYYINIIDSNNSKNNENRAMIIIENMEAPTATFDTDKAFNISFLVTNTGVVSAKNVKVTAKLDEDKSIVPKSSNTTQIQELKAGETTKVNFSFAPTAKSVTQSYTIGFAIEYETGIINDDDTKQKDSFEQFVGVNVVNSKADEKAAKEEADKEKEKEEKATNIPKIIISKYSVEPLMVMAGTEFDLSMIFKNTHSEKETKNIKAILTVPEAVDASGNKVSAGTNVFSPVNASNTFYVEKIAPQGSVEEKIRLYCVPDAAPKNYVLQIQFEYEDADGNPITAKEEIGVNVRQTAKLELGDVNIPANVMANEQVYLEFTVQNTGKVPLNNFKIKLAGDGIDTTGSEIIFGNFTAGDYQYYSASFTATEPGSKVLKLIINYDEDTGEHVEKIDEYPFEVTPNDMSAQGPGGMGMGMETDENGNQLMTDAEGNKFPVQFGEKGPTYLNGKPVEFDENGMPMAPKGGLSPLLIGIIVGGVVLVVVASVIIMVIKKKKNKQRNSEFDDID